MSTHNNAMLVSSCSRKSMITCTTDGSLQSYMKQVYSIPVLTIEEEGELTERWWKGGDIAAAQRLVLAHLKLVVKVAQNFRSYELPLSDMISEGNIGLMKAVQKFNVNMGCRLATYAIWWIKAAIQEYILKSWSMLKVSTSIMKKKLFCKLRAAKDNIMQLNKKISSIEDAYEADVETITYSADPTLLQLRAISLHQPISHDDEGATLLDSVISDDAISHEDVLISNQEKQIQTQLLSNSVKKLTDREKDILYRRRLKTKPDTLTVLSEEYGVSTERIRQIEERIIQKLRKFVVSHAVAATGI